YYSILAPKLIRKEVKELSAQSKRDLMRLNETCSQDGERARKLLDRILPQATSNNDQQQSLREVLEEHGFDREQHEQIRAEILAGRIGLAENRLPIQTDIRDVIDKDYVDLRSGSTVSAGSITSGEKALRDGLVGVVTLAAGVGSRWTDGAGVVKGLHPFYRFHGKHRSFVEVHLAKSRKTSRRFNAPVPHVFTTGYLTHAPIESFLRSNNDFGYPGDVILSPGMSVGLRMIPTVRDLIYYWEEMPHQVLDEQQQKVRESAHAAITSWARSAGEASDYIDNVPEQCMHPVGHWFEIPNMLRNGTLHRMLAAQPQLRYLMLHNIDTLGASLDPLPLANHIDSEACLSFEVIGRRIEDRGGGLARVDGKLRLLEGMGMPSDRDEFKLTYYSSMTTWISIDPLLEVFGITRNQLADRELVDQAVRRLAHRLPTYVTIKDVKKRWGLGQEDVFPVTQFEKLWGDMSSLSDVRCGYLVVDTCRGQQLKDPAQLDPWVQDGSAAYVDDLCDWDS
ncbi:MAG: UTP--glucose-1-phosphate uridylyltransferase, partial [Planctomycetes bacterium]|nr:UTP--glucose-1-phosphate uridylyltransferase [Planctomycetota bacterium]